MPLYFERPPTFQHIPDVQSEYVYIILYKNDGTEERKLVNRSYYFVVMWFELVRTCGYDMDRTHQAWKQWWNLGHLEQFNVDIQRLLTGE